MINEYLESFLISELLVIEVSPPTTIATLHYLHTRLWDPFQIMYPDFSLHAIASAGDKALQRG